MIIKDPNTNESIIISSTEYVFENPNANNAISEYHEFKSSENYDADMIYKVITEKGSIYYIMNDEYIEANSPDAKFQSEEYLKYNQYISVNNDGSIIYNDNIYIETEEDISNSSTETKIFAMQKKNS